MGKRDVISGGRRIRERNMKMPAAAESQPVNANSSVDGEKKSINPELWQACAGPLVNFPAAGTHVVYFPQGHSEQVFSGIPEVKGVSYSAAIEVATMTASFGIVLV